MLNNDITAAQRGYVYEAIGQLAQRYPSAFHGRTQIAEDLFAALETEPAGEHPFLNCAFYRFGFRGSIAAAICRFFIGFSFQERKCVHHGCCQGASAQEHLQ